MAKAGKKKGRRKIGKRAKRRGPSRPLAALGTADLFREIDRRRQALEAQRVEAEARLAAIETELLELGSPAGRSPATSRSKVAGAKKSGRGRRANSLVSILHKMLQGKTLGVPEMMEAARKAGHKSKAKNFRTIVNLAMLNNRNLFRRVSRGKYTAK